MASKCPNCGSTEMQEHAWTRQCLTCGRLSDHDGNMVDVGAGASTREAIEARLRPRETVVVGNLADLQRMGAELAQTDKGLLASSVVTAESVNVAADATVTPAQNDENKGEITRETVRTGAAGPLIKAREAAMAPRENKEPDSVDPTSVSPVRADKAKTQQPVIQARK